MADGLDRRTDDDQSQQQQLAEMQSRKRGCLDATDETCTNNKQRRHNEEESAAEDNSAAAPNDLAEDQSAAGPDVCPSCHRRITVEQEEDEEITGCDSRGTFLYEHSLTPIKKSDLLKKFPVDFVESLFVTQSEDEAMVCSSCRAIIKKGQIPEMVPVNIIDFPELFDRF